MLFLPSPPKPPKSYHFPRISHSLAKPSPKACLGGTRLPRNAYTTLPPDDTPLCRVITGIWQIPAQHGYVPTVPQVTRAIYTAVDAGFSTFDLSDVNREAESFASAYVRSVGRPAWQRVQFCTKLVLDPRAMEGKVSRTLVEAYVDRALRQMAQERIHLLQLQWADYRDERYIDFLGHLDEMRVRGKVRSVGTANFPTEQLRYIKSQGLRTASNQVSFSLLDRRPMAEMANWCQQNQIGLLAYSTLGGGLFSERYLGMPEPSRKACVTASLQRFATLIRVWGGWSLFQEMLYAVKMVADKHEVSMANVAVKWALEHPQLSAVIVGARLGIESETDHVLSNVKAFEFCLDKEDRELLDSVAVRGNDLYRVFGDSGNEYQPSR